MAGKTGDLFLKGKDAVGNGKRVETEEEVGSCR